MYAKDEGLAAFQRINVIDAFLESHQEGNAPELTFAAYYIADVDRSGNFSYGAGYWNQLVFRFVPAQLVGADLKAGLQFYSPRANFSDTSLPLGVFPGTTITGMADSYQAFGFLGCLFFALPAALFKNLWTAARHRNGLAAQLLYSQSIICAMRSVTHQSVDFLPGLLYNLIFMCLVFWYAKDSRQRPPMHENATQGASAGLLARQARISAKT